MNKEVIKEVIKEKNMIPMILDPLCAQKCYAEIDCLDFVMRITGNNNPYYQGTFTDKILSAIFGNPNPLWDYIWSQYAKGIKKELGDRIEGDTIHLIVPRQYIDFIFLSPLHDSFVRNGFETQLFFFTKMKQVFEECLSQAPIKKKLKAVYCKPYVDSFGMMYLSGAMTGMIELSNARKETDTDTQTLE